jgi:crotonobetainyl-CoA:carnitine CoA-transferase CaiB-like acyl-CoA transferase
MYEHKKRGRKDMVGALEGVRILDLSRLVPYQYATLLLADYGAEVIKIEEPGMGDYGRFMPPILKKESAHFVLLNRNKKSMKLNLKKEAGKKILKELARDADVLFETYRPGVMDKLGLGYEVMREINPRLIYCSGTGYGQNGPYRNRPGHDINYIGIAGILGVTGRHTGAPVIPGIPIADMAGGGVFSALGILLALAARERTGKGQYVDISMTDCMLTFSVLPISNYLAKLVNPNNPELGISGASLCYNVYPTKDGKWVSSGNLEEKFWVNFCQALGREDLIKEQFATGKRYQELKEELDALFRTKTRDEWLEIMSKYDVCFGPVLEPDEILQDPQLLSRDMVSEMEHPVEGNIKQLGFPVKLSATPGQMKNPPPILGQHTEEILQSLGYTPIEIENFSKEGVI